MTTGILLGAQKSMQDYAGDIRGLQSLPPFLHRCILEYLSGGTCFLDPRLSSLGQNASCTTMNNDGDIICATKEYVMCWNPVSEGYSLHKIAPGQYVDQVGEGRVVLVEPHTSGISYLLTILSGPRLSNVGYCNFPRYLEHVFEVSGDGSMICSAKNPVITNMAIQRIFCEKTRKDVSKMLDGEMYTVDVPKPGCMLPLVSYGGSYIGAYDAEKLDLLLWKFTKNRRFEMIHRIKTMPPSHMQNTFDFCLMQRVSLRERAFYWARITWEKHKLRFDKYAMKNTAVENNTAINMKSVRNSAGEELAGSRIITGLGGTAAGDHVRIIRTETRGDQYYVAVNTFDIMSGKSVEHEVPLTSGCQRSNIIQGDTSFLQKYVDFYPKNLNCFLHIFCGQRYEGEQSLTIPKNNVGEFVLSPNGCFVKIGNLLHLDVRSSLIGLSNHPTSMSQCSHDYACNPPCQSRLVLPPQVVKALSFK